MQLIPLLQFNRCEGVDDVEELDDIFVIAVEGKFDLSESIERKDEEKDEAIYIPIINYRSECLTSYLLHDREDFIRWPQRQHSRGISCCDIAAVAVARTLAAAVAAAATTTTTVTATALHIDVTSVNLIRYFLKFRLLSFGRVDASLRSSAGGLGRGGFTAAATAFAFEPFAFLYEI